MILQIVVYIGQVTFAANRLTSAVFPMNYNTVFLRNARALDTSYWQLWSDKVIWAIRISQWLVPLAAVLPINLDMRFVIQYVYYKEQKTLRLENDAVSTDVSS